ncbi:hypothetical protein PVK06_043108 [Gossypium arboreum]|uniref:Uncharacterized protein n=1 Tax=Gossypium arboreum TaxID=29729 RepID=A0ABR0MMK3_GOSAR|nr:hypothetical protein PVK06_043108 [Gossypium arboreum]
MAKANVATTHTIKASGNVGSSAQSIGSTRPLFLAEIEVKTRKELCFWCGAKYCVGHKCVRPQLYQLLLDLYSDRKEENLWEYLDQLEDITPDEDAAKGPILSLHGIYRSQGHNTIRIASRIGVTKVNILVDSGSTHNLFSVKLVRQLFLLIN